MSPKDDFVTIYFPKYLQAIFTSYVQKYTFIPNFTKRFKIMVAATLGKNLGPPIPKRSNDSYFQENQEL